MNKKQVVLYISIVLIIVMSIIACVISIINGADTKFDNSINIGEWFNNIGEGFNFSKGDNFDELIIELPSNIEENTNENNVFKISTKLKVNDENLMEEVKLYPYIINDEKYGYMNENGEVISDTFFDFADFFKDGLAMVENDYKYGFVDRDLNIVIPCEYYNVSTWGFENGLAIVEFENGESSVINKDNEVILNGKYDYIDLYYYGLIIAEKGRSKTYFNLNGEEIKLPNGYEFYSGFKNGIAEIWSESKGSRFINEKGQLLKISGAREYNSFYNGIATIDMGDDTNEIYVDEEFNFIYLKDRYSNLSISKVGNIHCVVDNEADFNNRYVYIDDKGNILFKSSYYVFDGFINNIGPVMEGDSYVFMDSKGNLINDKEYENIMALNDKVFLMNDGENILFLNSNGEVIETSGDSGIDTKNGLIILYKDENYNNIDIYDMNGNLIVSDKDLINDFSILDSNMIFIYSEDYTNEYYINASTKEKINYYINN